MSATRWTDLCFVGIGLLTRGGDSATAYRDIEDRRLSDEERETIRKRLIAWRETGSCREIYPGNDQADIDNIDNADEWPETDPKRIDWTGSEHEWSSK
jgi:hypothetical protein